MVLSRFFALLLFLLLLPLPSRAVQEELLPAMLHTEVLPAFYNSFQFDSFIGAQGRTIRYAQHQEEGAKISLVLVGGRTEYMSKYAELLYDLGRGGFSLSLYDHRGQGSSGRDLADPQKGYVEKFSYYAEDFGLFLDRVGAANPQSRIVVLAHSMGATIASAYEIEHPGRVAAYILSSPMLAINTRPFPTFLARWLSMGLTALGRGESYVFGGGPYDSGKEFEGNDLTQSRNRFQMNKELIAAEPQVALGAPTFRWVAEAFAGMDLVREGAGQLRAPVLLLSGEDDRVVGRAAQETFCSAAADCRFFSVAGAKHELLMESDTYRDQALAVIMHFLATMED